MRSRSMPAPAIGIRPAARRGLVPRDFTTAAQSQYPALSIYQRQYIVIDGFSAQGMLKIHRDAQGASPYVTIQNCDVIYCS